jgi:hypothetical protein
LLDDEKAVSTSAVKRVTGWSKGKAQNWFKTARDEGYIVGENVGRGKKAEYSLGADLPDDCDLLPTVNALMAAIKGDESPELAPAADSPLVEPEPSQNGHALGADPPDPADHATIDGHDALTDELLKAVRAYRHDSREWRSQVVRHILALRADGLRHVARDFCEQAGREFYAYHVEQSRKREAARQEYERLREYYYRTHPLAVSSAAVEAGNPYLTADGKTTPRSNAVESEFVIRRVAELRRDGYTREARALRELLPSRDEWREWRAAM